MPKVSVVMNCRNGEPFVADAISSVFAQTMNDLEIIFWDNLSTDGSAEIARSFPEKLRYFRSGVPLKLGQARKAALGRAAGEYVAILDVDDRWLPGKLEAQVRILDQQPGVALVYCDMERINEAGGRVSRWSRERRLERGRVLEGLLASCFIPMSTILIRRTALEEVGGFDPRFRQAEDLDLYLRLAEKYAIDYVDAVLVEERLHAHNTSRRYDEVAEEICLILTEWAKRAPEWASLCRRMIAVSRLKQYAVKAYRAFRLGSLAGAAASGLRCVGLGLRHPLALRQLLACYANPANARVFAARFSGRG